MKTKLHSIEIEGKEYIDGLSGDMCMATDGGSVALPEGPFHCAQN